MLQTRVDIPDLLSTLPVGIVLTARFGISGHLILFMGLKVLDYHRPSPPPPCTSRLCRQCNARHELLVGQVEDVVSAACRPWATRLSSLAD